MLRSSTKALLWSAHHLYPSSAHLSQLTIPQPRCLIWISIEERCFSAIPETITIRIKSRLSRALSVKHDFGGFQSTNMARKLTSLKNVWHTFTPAINKNKHRKRIRILDNGMFSLCAGFLAVTMFFWCQQGCELWDFALVLSFLENVFFYPQNSKLVFLWSLIVFRRLNHKINYVRKITHL